MELDLPLGGIRVLDLSTGQARYVGKLLAELGAEVVTEARQQASCTATDRIYNRGKSALAGTSDSQSLLDRAIDADLLIAAPDTFPDIGSIKDFERRHPELVILLVSDFGLQNDLTAWRGGEAIYQALGGQLSRSGIPGREPLIAPGGIATHSALVHATFLALLACLRKLSSGKGQVIDFAMAEGAAQALDPGFGIQGSATSGVPASELPRGRPEARFLYPILKCRDGFARVCVLSPRQWGGMFEWLGKPEEFADPSFANLLVRYRSQTLVPAIARLFADKTRAEIEQEAHRFGVPAAGLATLEEAAGNEHFAARRTLIEEQLPGGETVRHVAPIIEIDGQRPALGSDASRNWEGKRGEAVCCTDRGSDARPLSGLRVLDLGVIVVGAEAGRLLADFGADVIKVENPKFPDGARQTKEGDAISPGFAAGHRNKRSIAVNLREPQGRDLMLSLVRKSDVVLANFKPGTLESLGLGRAELLEANPAITLVESSAFGSHGPWSERGGYGPLVRAAAGLSYLWRYDDDPLGFSDALTVYPDHAAGRMSAIAALALLIRRHRTGAGGSATIAQVEVMLSHLGALIADIDLGSDTTPEQFVVPCKGDDEWCVVEAASGADRMNLRRALSLPEDASRDSVEASLSGFCADRAPLDAAKELQSREVAAAPMLRVPEMENFPFFRQREFLRAMEHPCLDTDYQVECAPVKLSPMGCSLDRPAPLMGEQTREIAAELLGLSDAEIARLLSDEILFETNSSD